MSAVWVVIGVVVAAAAIALVAGSRAERGCPNYAYRKQRALFTPAEHSFYGVLCQAVGERARVFGKVRVADVVAPEKGLSRRDWQRAFNKIAGKHFDFIICDKDDLSVICAVELNDRSHRSKRRQSRDAFLEGVCEVAGLPLIQICAKAAYRIVEAKALFASLLGEEVTPTGGLNQADHPDTVEDKACPRCDSPLVKRVARKGAKAGEAFWACSGYPKCRYIAPMNVPETVLEV